MSAVTDTVVIDATHLKTHRTGYSFKKTALAEQENRSDVIRRRARWKRAIMVQCRNDTERLDGQQPPTWDPADVTKTLHADARVQIV